MGKLITIVDNDRLLPANPDDWPAPLKQDIRNCCCGTASSGTASSGNPNANNPTYPINCCPGGANVNLSSVLIMNHGGSISHDGGMTLRKWPGGINTNPVPWIPVEAQWDNSTTGAVGTVYDGWYSDWFEDLDSGNIELFQTITDSTFRYDITYSYRDRWWKRYGAFYAVPVSGAIRGCAGFWNTYFRRNGTTRRVITRLVPPFDSTTETFPNNFPPLLPDGRQGYWMSPITSGGQECSFSVGSIVGCNAHASIVQCSPFYAKGYLYQGYNPEYSGIVASLPQYSVDGFPSPLFQWVDGSWLIEPNAWCSGGFLSEPVHSPYLEVMDASGTPFNFPWVPPS